MRDGLRRACYGRHSQETLWPRCAGVDPILWLVLYGMHEAREHLSSSTWNRYDACEWEGIVSLQWTRSDPQGADAGLIGGLAA